MKTFKRFLFACYFFSAGVAVSQTPGTCEQLSRGVDLSAVEKFDPTLAKFVDKLNSLVKKQDLKSLEKIFHPRLKIKESQLNGNFKAMAAAVGSIKSITLFRFWRLRVPEGRPNLIPCPEDDLSLAPHYGHEEQYAAWFQVAGEKNLARVFTSIVSVNKQWLLGSWHFAQWTHDGKDAETWITEAQQNAQRNEKILAYLKYDLASKLLDGGAFIFSRFKTLAEEARDSLYSRHGFLEVIAGQLKSKNSLVYTTSLLAKGGLGLVLRLNVEGEKKSRELKTQCLDLGKNLYKNKELTELAAIRCSFITGKEDPEREGRLGGLTLSKSSF